MTIAKSRQLRILLASGVALAAVLLAIVPASATDVTIINAPGCTVTEEDAVGPLLTTTFICASTIPTRIGASGCATWV